MTMDRKGVVFNSPLGTRIWVAADMFTGHVQLVEEVIAPNPGCIITLSHLRQGVMGSFEEVVKKLGLIIVDEAATSFRDDDDPVAEDEDAD